MLLIVLLAVPLILESGEAKNKIHERVMFMFDKLENWYDIDDILEKSGTEKFIVDMLKKNNLRI